MIAIVRSFFPQGKKYIEGWRVGIDNQAVNYFICPRVKRKVLPITVYPIPFFALFTEQGLPFPLATCVTVQAYTACQLAAYNKSRPKAAFVLFVLFYGIQIYRKETFECGV